MMFKVHQQHFLANFSIPQRNPTRVSRAVIHDYAPDTLFRKRVSILSKQMTELINIEGRNLKAHYSLWETCEHLFYSISQSILATFGPVIEAVTTGDSDKS